MRVWLPACNVTKRQLMPPPRLPRHLRPCRPLWSAHQVRFASDKPADSPSTAGGDSATLYATTKRLRVHSRNGRWRRDVLAAKPAESTSSTSSTSSTNDTYKSQAQRMREALGGGSASNTAPTLRIHRHLAVQDSDRQARLVQKRQAGASSETDKGPREGQPKREEQHGTPPQPKIQKYVVNEATESYRGAITTYLGKKDALQKEQQSGVSKESEHGLREKLKKLEEQLGMLQKKLEAAEAAEAAKAAEAAEAAEAAASITSTETASTLAQQIQAQSSSMKSSSHQQPPRAAPQPLPPASDEVSEQSLLDELFPEASSHAQPDPPDRRPSPPKLDLPLPDTNPRIRLTRSDTRSDREKAIDAFRARGETTTVLQLSNCSTALTEADFRRLIPRGLHIETWSRDGDFYRIIPGRDPLSLERLPFYYLLFHTPASALAYQKNASRLSKLSALHAPNGIHSAVAPPAGFLEDGEDIAAVTSQFVLHPQGHTLDLRTVMQPYNRALRALIDAGGYPPIVPSVDDQGRSIHRVLMHIDGYEPSHWDLWQIISRHAYARGIMWPFRNEHASALRKLRDCINLRTVSKLKLQAVAASNPRAAANHSEADRRVTDRQIEFEDAGIAAFLSTNAGEDDAKQTNQLVMNRVYNRWIVEFDDEDAARRFAGLWHRVVLPEAKGKGAWREGEEVRWVGCEYLW